MDPLRNGPDPVVDPLLALEVLLGDLLLKQHSGLDREFGSGERIVAGNGGSHLHIAAGRGEELAGDHRSRVGIVAVSRFINGRPPTD